MTARLYDLINPSDAVCFETEDEEALCIGVLLVGGGWYGLRREDGTDALKMTPFGPDGESAATAAVEWLKDPDHRVRTARALRTVLYCDVKDRKALAAAFQDLPPAMLRKAVERFNDAKRSSMSDISAACFDLADRLEKSAKEAANVPR